MLYLYWTFVGLILICGKLLLASVPAAFFVPVYTLLLLVAVVAALIAQRPALDLALHLLSLPPQSARNTEPTPRMLAKDPRGAKGK